MRDSTRLNVMTDSIELELVLIELSTFVTVCYNDELKVDLFNEQVD